MIFIYDDLQAMSGGAAELVAGRARAAAGDRFTLVLAGGTTPRPTYQLLAQPPLRDAIPWSKVHVFWGDERCVPRTTSGAMLGWRGGPCWSVCPRCP